MDTIKFTVKGTAPLMLHSAAGANPMHPQVKELKSITSKRTKSDRDIEDIAKLEWVLAMYFDDEMGPYIPGLNIDATLRDTAKLNKRGKDVIRAIQTLEDKVPIEYDGPRNLEKMWNKGTFADVRSVVVQRARLMRTRPIFHEWQCTFTLNFNEEIYNRDEVITLVKNSGVLNGFCEYRQRFGKFEVIKID